MPGFTEQLNHSVVSLQDSFHLFFELCTILCDPTESCWLIISPHILTNVFLSIFQVKSVGNKGENKLALTVDLFPFSPNIGQCVFHI